MRPETLLTFKNVSRPWSLTTRFDFRLADVYKTDAS